LKGVSVTISVNEVEYVARLARLELGSDEVLAMTEQLDRILNYIAKLNELDTAGVIPTTHVIAISNAFRLDTVCTSLSQQETLANGPEHNDVAFIVPRVI
jgi:aspartyl-tRNA(Asn)/glutamyl-tRNA(Gln) amidotransferase subunit C